MFVRSSAQGLKGVVFSLQFQGSYFLRMKKDTDSSQSKKELSREKIIPESIVKALKALPSLPGVYEMHSGEGETLYVGKAKDLKKRVKSYFQKSATHGAKTLKLIEKTEDLRWTETTSETEAIILESNLIKEKKPKFNILLRDDKSYAYFSVSIQEDFPRITLVRRIVKDGGLYFGPKVSSSSVRATIDLLRDIFFFRSTNLEIKESEPGKVTIKNPGNIKYPCINFHIKKCSGPCIGNISKEEYRSRIAEAVKFLKGDTGGVLRDLESRMKEAAQKQEFEKAARIRDLYLSVRSISEKQIVSAPDEFSADVIGAVQKFAHAFFHVFQIRDGKVINSETFTLPCPEGEDALETLSAFFREHADRAADFPKYLIVSGEIFPEAERESWEGFFTRSWGTKAEISLPKKGKRFDLLKLAEKNAEAYAVRNAASFIKHEESPEKNLESLQKALGLAKIPKRMECYDISHFGGTDTVASMVVFENGEAKNSHYRHFKLQTIEHGEVDDFKSMEEVLMRRLRHIKRVLPASYKIQKPIAKEDLVESLKILKRNGVRPKKRPTKDDFFILKNEKRVVGVLFRFQWEKESEYIRWFMRPEISDERYDFFLIAKCVEESDLNKIFVKEENPDRIDELINFGFERAGELPSFFKDLATIDNLFVFKKFGKKIKHESLTILPDLIVIDGGKGQLGAAEKVLNTVPFAREIALISIAKKEEEIFMPGKKQPVDIKKESPEGKLLQRIRDEAHRFALAYQQNLRQKRQQKSVLDDIPGIGMKTKKELLRKFGSIAGIREASDEELLTIVSKKVLQVLRQQL